MSLRSPTLLPSLRPFTHRTEGTNLLHGMASARSKITTLDTRLQRKTRKRRRVEVVISRPVPDAHTMYFSKRGCLIHRYNAFCRAPRHQSIDSYITTSPPDSIHVATRQKFRNVVRSDQIQEPRKEMRSEYKKEEVTIRILWYGHGIHKRTFGVLMESLLRRFEYCQWPRWDLVERLMPH